jgi:tetratricopeptide (TPR) repeat protein
MQSSSRSTTLQAAESILALVEDTRRKVQSLRHSAELLDDLVLRERADEEVLLESPESLSHIESPESLSHLVPPVRVETTDAVPYEEQQTQALDEELAATLEDVILEPEPSVEPPVRSTGEPPVRTLEESDKAEESVKAEDEADEEEEPSIELETPSKEEPSIELETPSKEEPSIELETPSKEPPAAENEAETRAEARARAAAQIRMATQHAENAIQRATAQSKKADDEAYRKARNQGVAAIQLTGDGSSREVRDLVAIAEAEEDDLEMEAARSSEAEGGLKVDVLVPEVDVQSDADLPELTDSAAPFSSIKELQVKENPTPGQIAQFLGNARAAETRGDLQEAIVAYGDALDVNGELEIAWLGRGRCRTELGEFGAALSDFKRAQALSPEGVSAVLEMGNLYYARKGYLQAIHYYGEALAIEPQAVLALGRRGLCHFYLEDSGQALRDLREAFEIDPSMPNLRQSLEMVEQSLESGD